MNFLSYEMQCMSMGQSFLSNFFLFFSFCVMYNSSELLVDLFVYHML